MDWCVSSNRTEDIASYRKLEKVRYNLSMLLTFIHVESQDIIDLDDSDGCRPLRSFSG